jgi:hypothetical protein
VRSFPRSRALLLFSLAATVQAHDLGAISAHDVIRTTPGKNSSDSMHPGKGELGINLWVEENGDLLFYLGRTNSCSPPMCFPRPENIP